LAVVAKRTATLLDSSGKKARALAAYASERVPGIQVLAERAENHAQQRPHEYSVAVARAVAPLASLVELAAPLLSMGGRLVCLKGAPDQAEIEAGDRVATIVGLVRETTRSIRLPEGREERTIVSYARVAESSVVLPRRVGRAQTRPLSVGKGRL
jgi:16S rRNA (guanine527-N7)-methyltransferase